MDDRKIIDFTNYEVDRAADYGGSDKKFGILDGNDRYMIKFSDKIPDDKKNSLNSSYTNSCLSEYIGCHIIQTLGLSVQETYLGIYTKRGSAEPRPVVACKNFLSKNEKLIQFKKIESAELDDAPPRIPVLSRLYDVFQENHYFTKEFSELAKENYFDLFVVDSLLGNFDRHGNNWGYVANIDTNEIIRIAPIYDCGSTLYPQIADFALKDILNNPEEIQKRIDIYPKPALSISNGDKTTYKEFMMSDNEDVAKAIRRIVPKVDLKKIGNVLDNTPTLSDIRKEFLSTMIKARYEQILVPAYEKTISRTPVSLDERIAQAKKICEKENAIRKEQSPSKSKNVDDILL